jgi:hypothetical protein
MPRSPVAQYRPFHPDEADYPFSDVGGGGRGIRVSCWGEAGCEHVGEISGDKLLAFGEACTIRLLFERLKCPACGSRRVSVHVVGVNTRPGQMSPD